jgi:hypothetical protein
LQKFHQHHFDTMTPKSNRGGAGRGQGRKKEFAVRIIAHATDAQRQTFKALGGPKWLRGVLDAQQPVNPPTRGAQNP